MEMKYPLFYGLLSVALAIVVSVSVASGTFLKVRSSDNAIEVTGSAERIIQSDIIKWSSNFSRTVGASELAAGNARLKGDLETVLTYFKSNGVGEDEITVNPVSVSPTCATDNGYASYDSYGRQICSPDRISGYNLSQSVVVESGKVKEVTSLAQNSVEQLVSKGLIFNSSNTEYFYSKLSDLRIDLLSEATKNAQERAENIAESAEAEVEKIKSVNVGVFQITPVNSAEFSDYGYYDTSSLEKKVTAVVRAKFILE